VSGDPMKNTTSFSGMPARLGALLPTDWPQNARLGRRKMGHLGYVGLAASSV